MVTHVLFESASGYAIFEAKLHASIESRTKDIQQSIDDLSRFSKMVSLMSFSPFKTAQHALENINDVSEGVLNDYLKTLLELNLSKPSKRAPILLGVSDPTLGASIKAELGIPCDASPSVSQELIRGIRLHAPHFITALPSEDYARAQLGLGHAYSRAKLKFNVNRADNMIIQAIATLDQLDKDVNLLSMRAREWYGYHFPELVRIVPDGHQYAKTAQFIGPKEDLHEDKLPALTALLDDDSTRAQNVLDAARGSMGAALSEIDMSQLMALLERVVSLMECRKSVASYLTEKMNLVAPNLTSLLGERIGARLISHAGSLTNLSKYPASTVQILGAEKALFRALKTKGNTPKYGLLYHSTFIGRAGPKHKGRISRFLANKCSIASRIDCFTETPTNKFGEALRGQVEERLAFFEDGIAPSKNADAIQRVLDQLALDDDDDEEGSGASDVEEVMEETKPQASAMKVKKEKKRKGEPMDVDAAEEDEEEDGGKKRKAKAKEGKEEKRARKKAKKDAAKSMRAAVEEAQEILDLPMDDDEADAEAAAAAEKARRKKEKKERRKSRE